MGAKNMNGSNNNYRLMQYRKMIQDGIDSQDAARAMGMELEEVNLAVMVDNKLPVTIEEIIEKARPEAVEILLSVMRGHIPDTRPSDMVKAAQIILENKGILPEVAGNAMVERLARMKLAKQSIINTDAMLIEVG